MKTNQSLEFYEGAVAAIQELFALDAFPTQTVRNIAAGVVDQCGAEIGKKRVELDVMAARLEAARP